MRGWIRDAATTGGRLLAGGQRDRAIFEPNIVADVSPEVRISCDELCGLAIGLMPFESVDTVIAGANDTNYGRSAAIFAESFGRPALRGRRDGRDQDGRHAPADRFRVRPPLKDPGFLRHRLLAPRLETLDSLAAQLCVAALLQVQRCGLVKQSPGSLCGPGRNAPAWHRAGAR